MAVLPFGCQAADCLSIIMALLRCAIFHDLSGGRRAAINVEDRHKLTAVHEGYWA